MDIKELNKVLAEALTENKPAMKRLHEDYESIDDIANEVAEQIKDEYDADNEISLDTYISETIDSNGYFSYMDDVIDLYKEIATYETGIYNDLSDAVFSEIKGRIENLLSDWKEENQIEESLKEGYYATKDMLEREAAEQFQPFISFEEYKEGKRNSYMIWGTDLVYVDEHGGQSEILTGASKTVTLNKIRAIRKYKEEIEIGRNKI